MGWVRRWHQDLEGMDGGWRALRGAAVTPHASFNGIALAPVLRLSVASMQEPVGGSCRGPSEGGRWPRPSR